MVLKGLSKFIILIVFLLSIRAYSEITAGRGGFFMEGGLSTVPNTRGNFLMFGGFGVGSLNENIHMGGGGGAGILLFSNPGTSINFGYGGPLLEYSLTPWLSGRFLLGAGGYALLTGTTTTGAGFLVMYPNVCFEIPISQALKAMITLGYFIATDPNLTTASIGVGALFGK